MFATAVLVVAAAAGGVAAVAGFGIGSLVTPVLALRVDTKTAVGVISVPHAIGTAIRFWRMRADLNRGVLWRFSTGVQKLVNRVDSVARVGRINA